MKAKGLEIECLQAPPLELEKPNPEEDPVVKHEEKGCDE